MSHFHPLRVASCRNETRDALVVTFAVPDELRDAFRFVQGQHITVRVTVDGEELRRSYSICSAPFEDTLRIAIKRVPDGVFSTWAHEHMKPGQMIECMEPAGHFNIPLDPGTARHHLAFAAGSGITPVLSIVKTTLVAEPRSHMTLVYGNRTSTSVLFREELADLKDRYTSRFTLLHIFSREHQDFDLFTGRIDRDKCEQLFRQWLDPASIDMAYICGPGSMMQQVLESLEAHHIERSHIRMELFSAGLQKGPRRRSNVAESPAQMCRMTVIQDGQRRDFSVPRDQDTILDSALGRGFELPYSCKGGVCSTCRCKLIRGEVEMGMQYALEDYEIARGFILPCQSYALTDELVLDYDQTS